MMYVIGDVHGCYKTLEALLANLPDQNRQICFVGDLIDRGPDSKAVIQLVRSMVDSGKAFCVQGNHEDMASLGPDNGNWLYNGGHSVIANYPGMFKDPSLKTDIEWMKTLPIVVEFKDLKNQDGRHLVVSHSAVAGIKDLSKLTRTDKLIILWGRNKIAPINFKKNVYNIFGHTPQKKPLITEAYSNIDTGCCYYRAEGYGKLTAISFPELTVYQQDYIDGDFSDEI